MNAPFVTAAKPPRLTRCQRQLVEHAAAGFTLAEIGGRLLIKVQSVDDGLGRARVSFGARNTVELVALALVLGLVDVDTIARLRAERIRR